MSDRMNRIIERLGEQVYTEQDVIEEFGDSNIQEILSALNEVYWSDDNTKLARMIHEEIKRTKERL